MAYSYDEFELTIKKDSTGKYKTKLEALKALRNELFNDWQLVSSEVDELKNSLSEVDLMIKEAEVIKK